MTDLSPTPLTPETVIKEIDEAVARFPIRNEGVVWLHANQWDAVKRSLAERDARIAELEGKAEGRIPYAALLRTQIAALEARNAALNDDAEHGWLAENPYARPHTWLAVDPKTADIYWTCDALLALRFARKTDCEQFIEVTQRSISGFVTRAIATEHGFAALTEQRGEGT